MIKFNNAIMQVCTYVRRYLCIHLWAYTFVMGGEIILHSLLGSSTRVVIFVNFNIFKTNCHFDTFHCSENVLRIFLKRSYVNK